MATIGDAEDDIVRSQNVSLFVGAAAGSTTPDDYALLRGVRFEKLHPETRTDHGLTRTYGHAAPDILLRFLLSASHDVFADIKTKSTRNARGVIPVHPWQFKTTADDNTNKNLTIKGKMFEYVVEKPDDTAQEPVDVECRIRITDETVTIT